jgi:hypothetical protein
MNSPSITPNLNILAVRAEIAVRIQRIALDGARQEGNLLAKLIDQSSRIPLSERSTTVNLLV